MGAISSDGETLPTLSAKNDHLGVLRHIRLHKLREPNMVITHGKSFLGTALSTTPKPSILTVVSSILGWSMDESEKLSVLEQMIVASIDVNDLTLADQCLETLKNCLQHHDGDAPLLDTSVRFRRLLGLIYEARGDCDSANTLYEELLTENPSNSYVYKRKFCIARVQSTNEVHMRDALNEYLENNLGDATAWLEMSKLSLSIGDYRGAAYCYEELVLCNPLDADLHCRLGEIYSTLGGVENLRLARKHLSQSLVLSPAEGNLRAVFGLISAAETFLEEVDSKGKKHVEEEEIEVVNELLKFGSEHLTKIYKGTAMSAVVAKVVG
mmetsp:Transcript_50936/g.59516  ORF Transcript_50936/g.59516 Transcript_50936/m.59516 type:complete len:325 (+) Transcript_50936:152-1126(+)